jgi:hypothetical protein
MGVWVNVWGCGYSQEKQYAANVHDLEEMENHLDSVLEENMKVACAPTCWLD